MFEIEYKGSKCCYYYYKETSVYLDPNLEIVEEKCLCG